MEKDNRKSVYRYGAEDGRYMGLYFIAMSACLIASPRVPALLLLMSVLLAGVPVMLYLMLRRMYREAPHNRTFSAIWTAGIMITLCGSLICALVTAAWLIYVQPDFFAEYLRTAIATVQQSGQSAEYQEQMIMMQRALESGTVPSPMQLVLSMVWSTVFFGSILSMVCAWALMFRGRRSMRGSADVL